ncbi:DUF3313 family protein [Parvularcula oceani]|uniref:DUF3313 family protein n=1 Tax=Parvularcula oceani TaxID=1247963 RepID=UPI0004E1D6B5|nr:DUF3313 family protein [Parvularcula oceani]
MRNLFASVALVALGACATPTGMEAASRFDSFEAAAPVQLGDYDRVYLAPIAVSDDILDRLDRQIYRGTRDSEWAIDERTINAKVEDLREDLVAELSERTTLVDAPGPGVLTIQLTLTELASNRPTIAALSEEPSLSFQSISTGGAAVEAQLLEGDRVLAMFEDRSRFNPINDPVVQAGIWTEADRYFRQLGDKLAALLA